MTVVPKPCYRTVYNFHACMVYKLDHQCEKNTHLNATLPGAGKVAQRFTATKHILLSSKMNISIWFLFAGALICSFTVGVNCKIDSEYVHALLELEFT